MTAKYAWQKGDKSKWVSMFTMVIIVISVIVLTVIIYSKFDQINNLVDETTENIVRINDTDYKIWDSATLSGAIEQWNLVNYTHQITVWTGTDAQVFGLNSNSINLAKYQWDVEVSWTVSDIKNGVILLNISKVLEIIEDTVTSTWDVQANTWDTTDYWDYVSSMIWFEDSFYEDHNVDYQWQNIIISTKSGENLVNIEYFVCKNDLSAEDCDKSSELFDDNSNTMIASSYWLKADKLPEIDSWFMQNGEVWYYINDVDQQVVKNIISKIIPVNEWYIKNNIKSQSTNICKDQSSRLDKITEYELKNNTAIVIKIDGTDQNGSQVKCALKIEPNNLELLDFEVLDTVVNTWTNQTWTNIDDANTDDQEDTQTQTWTVTNQTWTVENQTWTVENQTWDNSTQQIDFDVSQFPLKQDKSVEFSSRRWHTITFPSPSIAYSEVNVSETFDQNWVSCFASMNVTDYDEKDSVETNPSVQIFECTVKNGFDDSDKSLIYKTIWDKSFVIKINDGAWYDFANNIQIRSQ